MRDARDMNTLEIPGVEPPPAKPVRTTIAERMAACVYMGPRQVMTCRNCRHMTGRVQLHARCGLHDLPVQLGGLCADHEE